MDDDSKKLLPALTAKIDHDVASASDFLAMWMDRHNESLEEFSGVLMRLNVPALYGLDDVQQQFLLLLARIGWVHVVTRMADDMEVSRDIEGEEDDDL